ncbi:DegV family EDD domain-containing protein [Levilactobacillus brevis]|uniref:DegV family protein n=1 Tax=Levilactobacillus brevis TaxID=1580 RepID=UPI0021A6265B|nr:DegV family protein [Levilactobacillus brevis]MCT3566156.1 DegV family EDD domain-containing protein [Levilactobacillus brevis]
MKVAVLTDTSAGIEFGEAKQQKITLLAAPIMFGNRQYHEYQDLPTADYYRLLRLAKSKKLVPTAPQISMKMVHQTCDELAATGVTDVIVIGPSLGISGFVNTLAAYAENITSLHVWPWDSRGILTTMGDQARLAAMLAVQGTPPREILEQLKRLRDTTHSAFVVDSIKPLLRTGEVNGHGPGNAPLLPGKPILVFESSGKMRVAGSALRLKGAMSDFLDDLAAALAEAVPVKATILNADQPETTAQWLATAQKRFPSVKFDVAEIGPSFGVHVGDGAMGLAWSQDYQSLISVENEK